MTPRDLLKSPRRDPAVEQPPSRAPTPAGPAVDRGAVPWPRRAVAVLARGGRWRAVALGLGLLVLAPVGVLARDHFIRSRATSEESARVAAVARAWDEGKAAIASGSWGALRRHLTGASVRLAEEMRRIANERPPSEGLSHLEQMIGDTTLPADMDALLRGTATDSSKVVSADLVDARMVRAHIEDDRGKTYTLYFRNEEGTWKLDLMASIARR
jgi:hypothetical protein